MNKITDELLRIVSDFTGTFKGAYNIREDGGCAGRQSTKNIEITSEEVREALADPVNQILDAIRSTLEKTPPELSADIIDRGIMLTGGGALLRGLDKLISIETKIPVHVADNPLDCVVDGTGKCLENDEILGITGKKNYD